MLERSQRNQSRWLSATNRPAGAWFTTNVCPLENELVKRIASYRTYRMCRARARVTVYKGGSVQSVHGSLALISQSNLIRSGPHR